MKATRQLAIGGAPTPGSGAAAAPGSILTLDKIFADTVARGWAPRSPAYGAELSRCEATYVRGDCTAPLLLDGDVAYIDPLTRAQPGDLVSFALSRRGAEAQNSALPAGQSRWRAGDRWAKLYAEYGPSRIAMLLDRHGHSATATLMACESPDEAPVLWPVRNVRRNGRLLFAPHGDLTLPRRSVLAALGAGFALVGCDQVPMLPPCRDSDGAELGLNAATTVASTSTSGVTLTTTITAILSLTVGPFPAAATVVVTASGYLTAQNTSGTVLVSPEMAYAIHTVSGALPAGHPFWDIYSVPLSSTVGQNFAYEQTFSLAANTQQTYYFNASEISTTNNVLKLASLVLKAEAIVR